MNDEPLAGFTVGVTAVRRQEELAALLDRMGARVVHTPAIRLVPPADDTELIEATRRFLAGPVDVVLITACAGFRAWLEAAERWGCRDDVVKVLAEARILTPDPWARQAVRAMGVTGSWPPAPDSWQGILRQVLEEDVTGRRVAVQLTGDPPPRLIETLRCAGAEVLRVPVYRWGRAEDPTPLRRLVGQTVTDTVDAIIFSSAAAIGATLAVAAEDGLDEALLEALRTRVVAACASVVAAAPLEERGVRVVAPRQPRLGSLVRALGVELPARSATRLAVDGHTLELRGNAVVLDGQLRPIAPAPMAILRALARRPGHVVSRTELCGVLPGRALPRGLPGRKRSDEHAVEMAVARLRRSLGPHGLVETVVKRGYRLAEPS